MFFFAGFLVWCGLSSGSASSWAWSSALLMTTERLKDADCLAPFAEKALSCGFCEGVPASPLAKRSARAMS